MCLQPVNYFTELPTLEVMDSDDFEACMPKQVPILLACSGSCQHEATMCSMPIDILCTAGQRSVRLHLVCLGCKQVSPGVAAS